MCVHTYCKYVREPWKDDIANGSGSHYGHAAEQGREPGALKFMGCGNQGPNLEPLNPKKRRSDYNLKPYSLACFQFMR